MVRWWYITVWQVPRQDQRMYLRLRQLAANPSPQEVMIVLHILRAKLFVLLRTLRCELMSPAFQEELARILYADASKGQPPISPAQPARRRCYKHTEVFDGEVIEATMMDRRWPLVRGCLDILLLSFRKVMLIAFQQWLIARNYDWRPIERVLEVAHAHAAFRPLTLWAAPDSSPMGEMVVWRIQ